MRELWEEFGSIIVGIAGFALVMIAIWGLQHLMNWLAIH